MTTSEVSRRHRLRIGNLLFAFCLGLLADAALADYLEPELRQRVEALKAAVASSPTTQETVAERAQTLWEWGNAFALAGRYVPVNLTTAARPKLPAEATRGMLRNIDFHVLEMTLFDEEPDAIGTLTADTGPFEARSLATFGQTYTVGSKAIDTGGGFVIAKHFMADHGTLQTTDPAAPNYLSIATSGDAEFAADAVPLFGMHGGFRSARDVLFMRVASGRLEPGDTVTIAYGARDGGGAGLRMPSFSSDRMPFPLYVAFDGSGMRYSLPIQPIRVSGSTLAGVHGFAPSVVRPNEPFSISVRAQDVDYNRAKPPYPHWRVYENDRLLAETPVPNGAIVVLDNLRIAEQGVYRLRVESKDGSIRGDINPILVSEDAKHVYWGDTHGHSGFAEGIGTPDRFMVWARDDARLDFVTHSEHDIWTDDYEWEVLKQNVAKYSEEGRFVAYLGYEWTARNIHGGHHNVLFRTPTDRQRIPTQFHPTLSDLYQGLRAKHDPRDVLVIPHAHQTADYRHSDGELEPLVEIMSQHGTFEWFARMYLKHGHRVGFTAASDNHLSQPGYSAPRGLGLAQRGGLGAVMAQELSNDAIFDAMKALRVYATSGERMILDFRVNEGRMGQRIAFATERNISGRVIGTAPIQSITIIKNDEVIWERDYLTIRDGKFAREETFYISFDSQSHPMHRGDNPRGWRPWRGRLEVVGAKLMEARPTDFANADMQSLNPAEDDPNVLLFATATRGDASSIRLRLRNIKRKAKIVLSLEQAREHGGAPPIYRPPATLPASRLELHLRDLDRGMLQKTLSFDVFEDTVTLRRRIDDGAMDVRFEFNDTGTTKGDYYFVRITQVDDAMAWSSPIWVGDDGARQEP